MDTPLGPVPDEDVGEMFLRMRLSILEIACDFGVSEAEVEAVLWSLGIDVVRREIRARAKKRRLEPVMAI